MDSNSLNSYLKRFPVGRTNPIPLTSTSYLIMESSKNKTALTMLTWETGSNTFWKMLELIAIQHTPP